MKRLFTSFMTLALFVLLSLAKGAPLYETLPNEAPLLEGEANKVEVVEIFSYTCGVCNNLHPFIDAWAKEKSKEGTMNFIYFPYPTAGPLEIYAKAYYAFQSMGIADEYHGRIFDLFFKDKKRLNKKEDLADFLAKKYQLDKEEFLKNVDSFAANLKFKRSIEYLTKYYQVDYTPAIIVNGKYLVNIEFANRENDGSKNPYEQLIEVLNDLVDELNQQNKTASTSETPQ